MSKIDELKDENIEGYLEAISNYDELEAQLYYDISKGRLEVINNFAGKIADNKLEKILQKYLFNHLWLLDPSWDRATDDPVMEKKLENCMLLDGKKVKEKDKDETGRIDIKYRKSGGEHVIIELKRAGIATDTSKLLTQIHKYHTKMGELLEAEGRPHEPFEIICVVGKNLTDWKTENGKKTSADILKPLNARVITYQQLIHKAHLAYAEYLDKQKKASKIHDILNAIENSLNEKV